MICPNCRKNNDEVIDSRERDDGRVYRRRRCRHCRRRWTTYESPEDLQTGLVAAYKVLVELHARLSDALAAVKPYIKEDVDGPQQL